MKRALLTAALILAAASVLAQQGFQLTDQPPTYSFLVWRGADGQDTYWVADTTKPTPTEAFRPVTIRFVRWSEQAPPGPTPPPGPIPPGPTPKPTPAPGLRQVVIVRESADATPATSRLIVAMRSGPSAEYLSSKGHAALILDDDAVDPTGKPPKILSDNASAITEIGLPCVLILDASGKLLAKAKLPATAAEVIDLVKANGG